MGITFTAWKWDRDRGARKVKEKWTHGLKDRGRIETKRDRHKARGRHMQIYRQRYRGKEIVAFDENRNIIDHKK